MSKESSKQPTIFLVEEDNDTRPILKKNLEHTGYRVRLAVDEEDAQDRVSGGRLTADLILVNLVGAQPNEALLAGRRIRQNAELDVPLVVMAEKYDKDVEGTEVNVKGNDWIFYLGEEPDQLKNLLNRLLSKPSA